MTENEWTRQSSSTDTRNLNQGPLFAGKYKILSKLGEGGMGTVYLVHHALLNTEFALKVLQSEGAASVALTRRFQQEAKATFTLNHPNLVRVHEFGLSQLDEPYLIMDVIHGVTLSEFVKKHGAMDVRLACQILSQVSAGLAYAHRMGVIHRDIKPGNIMVPREITAQNLAPGSVKILDFGIAKITSGEGQALTRTGELIGSPFYMSPEQCSGLEVTGQSDIYSLGCVLFELLTGSPPHIGATAMRTMMLHVDERVPSLKEATLGSNFPESVENTVRRMMEKTPSRRIQSAEELHETFESMLTRNFANPETFKFDSESKKSKWSFDIRHPVSLVAGGLLIAVLSSTLTHLIDVSVDQAVDASKAREFAFSQSDTLPIDPTVKAKATQSESSDTQQVSGQSSTTAATLGASATGKDADTGKLANAAENSGQKQAVERPLNLNPPREKMGDHYYRRFVFPAEPIGRISQTVDKYYPDARTEKAAMGPLCMIDSGSGLQFKIESKSPSQIKYIDQHSKLFASLSRDAFVSLVISLPTGAKEFDVMIGQATDADVSEQVQQKEAERRVASAAFSAVLGWKNLHVIRLESVNLTDSQIADLAKIPSLLRLRLESCRFDADKVARLPCLKTVSTLELMRVRGSELLHAVSGSANLRSLLMRDLLSFSSEDIKALSSCKALDYMSIRQAAILDDAEVDAITALPRMQRIVFENKCITPAQVSRLLTMRSLRALYLPVETREAVEGAGVRDGRIVYARYN